MSSSTPLISVLLPIYNAAPYLQESLNSLLKQSYTHLEIVAIDDGSTDNSWAILQTYAQQDNRIKLYCNKINLGFTKTLNTSIPRCTGAYIARMDADDIAHPERLAKQLETLEKNTNCKFCGTYYSFFPTKVNLLWLRLQKIESQSKYLRPRALFFTPIVHPSLMVETNFYKQFQYSEKHPVADDYELFTRMLRQSDAMIVEEQLLKVRLSTTSYSTISRATQLATVAGIYRDQFHYFQVPHSESDLQTHLLTSESNDKQLTANDLDSINDWLRRLQSINQAQSIFDQAIFHDVLSIVWFKCCRRADLGGIKLYRIYNNGNFARGVIPNSLQIDMFVRASIKKTLNKLGMR